MPVGDSARLVAVKPGAQVEALRGGFKNTLGCGEINMNENKGYPGSGLQNWDAGQKQETSGLDRPGKNAEAKASSPGEATARGKRKCETAGDGGPPTKNRACRAPRQETLEAAKYVSHANALTLRGEGAKLDHDIDVKLPSISQAPACLQEHLRGLETAGLRLPHAVPTTINTHVRVLGGLCHAFEGLSPWLSERPGEASVEDFKWKPQGLSHPLHSHQVLASAIMIMIEKDADQGSGLLLDCIGFGKTVQTLACIVSNRVRPRRGKCPMDGSATTLVVVPKSAATQWVDEVKRHTKPQLSAVVWTNQSETSRTHTLAADILIVTYDQVRTMWNRKYGSQSTSLLFDVCFHRVILDEAHKIKCRKSSTFKACMGLRGSHRWALTGTPIPNGVHELWPLLKFIRHPNVKDFAHFKANYLRRKGEDMSKGGTKYEDLGRLLLPISIMRAPGHQFCGLPLVGLPRDRAVEELVPLSAEEQVILGHLKKHIMRYIESTSGGKSNSFCLFERFTRHRQFSASPLLLEGPVKNGMWTLGDVKQMRDAARAGGCRQTPVIDLFERWMLEPKSHHLAPTGDKKIDAVIAKIDGLLCPLCSRRPADPVLAECSHLWCRHCAERWVGMCAACAEPAKCPKCNRVVGALQKYEPKSDSDQYGGDRGRGDDHSGFQPAGDDGSTLFQDLDRHPEEPIPQSAKLGATLDRIIKWQTEAPDDKIIGEVYLTRPVLC